MEIKVIRKYFKETYTIGNVFVDGQWFSNSLENKDRGLDQSMPLSQLKKLKKYGITAIPTGRYEVKSYFWPKYRKTYPLLMNVPAFTGILIHGMQNASQSLGCIGIGENKRKGEILNSRVYVRRLTEMLISAEKKGEKTYITIE